MPSGGILKADRKLSRLASHGVQTRGQELALDKHGLYDIRMKIQYKSRGNLVDSGKCHVLWCPDCGRPLLVGKVEKRLRTIIRH